MNSIVLKPQELSGRYFSKRELSQVLETVQRFSSLGRTEIAFTICEHLSWKTQTGSLKINSCLTALEKLERMGYLKLPQRPVRKKRQAKTIIHTEQTKEKAAICCSLEELGSIELQVVSSKREVSLWNEYVDHYHYLGYKHPIGNSLRYFIVSKKTSDQILGCLMFSSSVWSLMDRDNWIGWDEKDRKKNLRFIINNNRFLIFPWVRVDNLVSKIFSIIFKQIVSDWQEAFSYKPVLVESFVDLSKYSGSCYRAANWECIGKTSGRKWQEGTDGSVKTVFVYPLVTNFRGILTNQKKKVSTKQLKIDESFVHLWGQVITIIAEVAYEFDKTWQKRKRIIDSLLLVFLIFRITFSKNRQGYRTTIDDFWANCHKMNFPLPQKKAIAASAFTEARAKLDENIFKVLNSRIIEAHEDKNGSLYLWNSHRLFAVDGSKINLPRELVDKGYKVPSEQCHYPQGLLSCIYQLKSKIPYDFDLVNHGDERKCALSHLKALKKTDVVVYDRGYFSYAILYYHIKAGIYPVFRLQKNSFTVINEFRESEKVDEIVTILPSKETQKDINKKYPYITIVPLKLRLIKYTIDNKIYCIGTTLMNSQYEVSLFKELYHSRWGIEELYKISKEFIDVEDFHGKSERGVKQELFAHFVMITMNRLYSNHTENLISKIFTPLERENNEKSEIKVNFKHCLSTVARHLEEFMFVPARSIKNVVETIVDSVFRYRQKVRPNRSYKRKSMKPTNKWRQRTI